MPLNGSKRGKIPSHVGQNGACFLHVKRAVWQHGNNPVSILNCRWEQYNSRHEKCKGIFPFSYSFSGFSFQQHFRFCRSGTCNGTTRWKQLLRKWGQLKIISEWKNIQKSILRRLIVTVTVRRISWNFLCSVPEYQPRRRLIEWSISIPDLSQEKPR